MTMDDRKKAVFDDPVIRRRLVRGLILGCMVLLGLDAIMHRHVDHPWEGLFGFYALYGFAACVALVVAAKKWRRLVMRPEDYYEGASQKERCHGIGAERDG
jgi:hypothetical protein